MPLTSFLRWGLPSGAQEFWGPHQQFLASWALGSAQGPKDAVLLLPCSASDPPASLAVSENSEPHLVELRDLQDCTWQFWGDRMVQGLNWLEACQGNDFCPECTRATQPLQYAEKVVPKQRP